MLSLTGGWLKFISGKQIERNQKTAFGLFFQPFFRPILALCLQNPDETGLSFCRSNGASGDTSLNEPGSPSANNIICFSFSLFCRQTGKAELCENRVKETGQGQCTAQRILAALTKLPAQRTGTCLPFSRQVAAITTVLIATTTDLILTTTVLITGYVRPHPPLGRS